MEFNWISSLIWPLSCAAGYSRYFPLVWLQIYRYLGLGMKNPFELQTCLISKYRRTILQVRKADSIRTYVRFLLWNNATARYYRRAISLQCAFHQSNAGSFYVNWFRSFRYLLCAAIFGSRLLLRGAAFCLLLQLQIRWYTRVGALITFLSCGVLIE